MHPPVDASDFSEAESEVVTAGDGVSCSYKAIGIQKNLTQVSKIGAHQENTAQKCLRLTFTIMGNSYRYVSNKDLSRIKSPLDNIMRGVFEDKKIGAQAIGDIYEPCSDIRCYMTCRLTREYSKLHNPVDWE